METRKPSIFVFYGPGQTGKTHTARRLGATFAGIFGNDSNFSDLDTISDDTEWLCFDPAESWSNKFDLLLSYLQTGKVTLVNWVWSGNSVHEVRTIVRCRARRVILIFNSDPRQKMAGVYLYLKAILALVPESNYMQFRDVE